MWRFPAPPSSSNRDYSEIESLNQATMMTMLLIIVDIIT